MGNRVIYEDLGLDSLAEDAARLLEDVLEVSARAVEGKMKGLIEERGFVDTRATKNSVQVDPASKALERDIGPTTRYAIYGELGRIQTHVYGRKIKQPIHHPGLHFARDALYAVKDSFLRAAGEAMRKLGGRR